MVGGMGQVQAGWIGVGQVWGRVDGQEQGPVPLCELTNKVKTLPS